MRPVVITQNMTVDGSIEMLDDWFDPTDSPPDQQQLLQRDSAACDALLLGRQTFEDFRGFWPVQENDTTGITDELNTLQKYVVTATMTDPAWQHSTLIDGDPVAAVRELKEQSGAEISLTGSIMLCHPLIEAGLVDEYRIWTYPHVQGRGRRLFPDGFHTPLRLLEQHGFDSGVTYARWAPKND